MAPSKQLAATIAAGGSIVVQEIDVPKPGPGEILVKVVAIAQNQADWKFAEFLGLIGPVAGHDFSGTVEEVGPDVPVGLRTVGERVAGFIRGGLTSNGAFAGYLVASAQYGIVHIPDSWSFEDAAQLGVAPFTAIQTLYESHSFPRPPVSTPTSTPLLVYGASSSVGQWVVQFAKLSGLYVIAITSQKNAELVKSLGADEVYDYRDPEVAQKIKASTKGALKHVVDTISEELSSQIVFNSLSDDGGVIAAIMPYQKPPRENIKVINSHAFVSLGQDYDIPFQHVSTAEVKERVLGYAKLLQEIINTTKVKPNPVLLFPKGLASVPDGFQYMKEGKVSGQKITYCIADTPKN